ncbi:MAG: 50S ribosomal protein L11 methyltransferase [Pseudobdellovibrionaceae bacterium]
MSPIFVDTEDEISQIFFAHGAAGSSESLQFTQPDLTYEPRIMTQRMKALDFFFMENPSTALFEEVREKFPQLTLTQYQEEQQDWMAEWKKHFKAFALVKDFWVVPSWLEIPLEAKQSLKIDPGMAFGTGTHATTQMAAKFIYLLQKQYPAEFPNWDVLDVGTGTAILAMLAGKYGGRHVIGIEIDPEARRVARENIVLNDCENVMIIDDQIEDFKGHHNIVIANIVDGVLIRLREDLARATLVGGHLFVTGILLEREDHFFSQFIEPKIYGYQFVVQQRLEKDEWVGYWLTKQEI